MAAVTGCEASSLMSRVFVSEQTLTKHPFSIRLTDSVVPEKLEAVGIYPFWKKERPSVSQGRNSFLGRDFWQVVRPPQRWDRNWHNVGSPWWTGPHHDQNFLVINASHPLFKPESHVWTPKDGLRQSFGFPYLLHLITSFSVFTIVCLPTDWGQVTVRTVWAQALTITTSVTMWHALKNHIFVLTLTTMHTKTGMI